MNPLARLVRAWGHEVQGSDRSFDLGKNQDVAARLGELGIVLAAQDGAAIHAGLERFVYSTAVEADTPEVRAAKALGLDMIARPALLAEIVGAGRPGVAIAGTSGKSTVTGMLAWILRQASVEATVLGGAPLVGEGVAGCFVAGPPAGPVVVEACESDGTLVGYRPGIGVILNVSRDHAEVSALREQFAAFARNARRLLVNAGCAESLALGRSVGALTFGTSAEADVRLEVLSAGPDRGVASITIAADKIRVALPQPGVHNLENAAAAAAVALELGVPPQRIESALARFPGIARRFEIVGVTPGGVRVVDDFAHNGEKIRAAITTAQAGCRRLVAVFQPHGFSPARFLRPELRELLPRLLRPDDRFCYAEIYYAGGTVTRDVSSRDLAADLPPDLRCVYAADHAGVVEWVVAEAHPGDTVLLMGARDPDLARLARSVFTALSAK